ncbi:MAG: hypothetical protein COV44_06105 [Deltaproteobacteria bacterium CG11_big_fil_rev_8_21_14_0_20_45_16]|nr:MAG: hypothetical protein COV44_06105 [Deltaproteobacteria bacterium CG11_big_fil_rev_8_21_14_0_20_45_16]
MTDRPLSRSDSGEAPEKFGRYDLLEHLASGGMAKIYRASTNGNRSLIIKKILPDYSANEDFIKMFLEEAKISLALKHNNIVRVIDFGANEGTYYLAMEYVFGQDLGSLLKRSVEQKIHIPLDAACLIIMQCCRGLDYAHHFNDGFGNQVSIVHRDISPPNILISYNGEAKVLDFGIAKAVTAVSNKNTRSGILKGKFCYMSPEQAQGMELDRQSDVFSLGIVFHELLCSKSLFYTKDEIETLERVCKAKVNPPSKIRKGLPKELDRIVLKALKLKKSARYGSCGELADDIQAFLKKYYPRSDTRAVAKVTRLMFREDFDLRVPEIRKESWKDIFVSGGADTDLLLDRFVNVPSSPGIRHAANRNSEIGLLRRLLYDPKVNKKFVRSSIGLGSLLFVLCSGFYLWTTPYGSKFYEFGSKNWTSLIDQPGLVQIPENSSNTTDETRSSKPEMGSLLYWVNKGTDAEKVKDWPAALRAYDRALNINSFESSIEVKRQFVLIRMGRLEKPCAWFKSHTELELADRILAEALCYQGTDDITKAVYAFGDFLRKFPNDPRTAEVKSELDAILRSVK